MRLLPLIVTMLISGLASGQWLMPGHRSWIGTQEENDEYSYPTDGLISWWKLDANGLDSYGTFHASVTNGPAATTGHLGDENGAYDFVAAQSDYLSMGSAAATDTAFDLQATNFTFAVWIYRINLGPAMTICAKGRYNYGGWELGFGATVSDHKLYFSTYSSGSSVETLSGSYPTANQAWTHVAAVRSGTAVTLYINGTNKTATAGTHVNFGSGAAYDLCIGCQHNGSIYQTFWNGYLDDVLVYNRALSSNEVYQMWLNTQP